MFECCCTNVVTYHHGCRGYNPPCRLIYIYITYIHGPTWCYNWFVRGKKLHGR